MLQCLPIALLVLAGVVSFGGRRQAQLDLVAKLPPASGKFGIGRVGFDWVDQKRPEPLSGAANAHRELMVYVWYPASASRANSPEGVYLPRAKEIEKTPGTSRIKENVFEGVWPRVLSGEVTSHAQERALPAKSAKSFPVILFSHGGGSTTFGYTALIECLVSHGYIVAAIEHTYEAAAVAFPDGRVIPYSEENVRRTEKPPSASYDQMVENAMSWVRARDDVFAADQRFVVDQLVQINDNNALPFAGQLDLNRVAAVGHSMGGQASMRACQLDDRIKACVNLDGGNVDGVLIRYSGASAPKQPALYVETPFMPISADHLKELRQTRAEWIQLWRARARKQLRAFEGGSYYAVLKAPGMSHRSYSDQNLLAASGRAAQKESLRNLQLIEAVTLAFTDKYLKGIPSSLLDQGSQKNRDVSIERFNIH
jgi:predicted dienelactone hydrolase